MNSIDNLREYVLTAPSICSTTRAILVGYIDEIEREVKELTDERDLLKTQWEAGVDFDQRLEACADKREDVTLWGVDYMPCPLDADGKPIHVGDVLTDGEYTFVVDELAAFGDGSWSIRNEDGNAWAACDVTHHHVPTVEDVLEELLREYDRDDSELTNGEIIERFAAKLQLKED